MTIFEQEQKPFSIKHEASTNWLSGDKETFLLYGPPKGGKTWAYCSIIEKIVSKGGRVFIINTDGGVSKTFRQYFGDKAVEVSKNIKFFFASKIDDVFIIIPQILAEVKAEDLIIIDLISDFWELAQNKFMEEITSGDVVNFIVKASNDRSKFGLFEASKWNYIKKLDNYLIEKLIISPPCFVVGVCAEKDIDVDKALTGKNYEKTDFEISGARPAGQKQLSYKFHTIIYINRIDTRQYFQVIGDRGSTPNSKMITYEKSFINKLSEVRK